MPSRSQRESSAKHMAKLRAFLVRVRPPGSAFVVWNAARIVERFARDCKQAPTRAHYHRTWYALRKLATERKLITLVGRGLYQLMPARGGR